MRYKKLISILTLIFVCIILYWILQKVIQEIFAPTLTIKFRIKPPPETLKAYETQNEENIRKYQQMSADQIARLRIQYDDMYRHIDQQNSDTSKLPELQNEWNEILQSYEDDVINYELNDFDEYIYIDNESLDFDDQSSTSSTPISPILAPETIYLATQRTIQDNSNTEEFNISENIIKINIESRTLEPSQKVISPIDQQTPKVSTSITESPEIIRHQEPFQLQITSDTYECCDSNRTFPYRKNILFLKTHKCASSTVQNILMRFGLRNDLNFMLPYFFYLSYYETFREDFLPLETRTVDGKYNILTHHVRYKPNLKSYLYPDAAKVTILRSPAAVFEGMYNYFSLNYKLGKSFEEFLKSPNEMETVINDPMPVYHGYNQMSMDLGLDLKQFENITAIKVFIQFIENEFDFIMITEYFDESLILLAHLMGWPLHHVAYVPVNKRNEGIKYHLTDSDREKLKEVNLADNMLYNYFLKKFLRCREQYGVELLQKQVQRLKKMNEELRTRCVYAEHTVPVLGVVGYDMKNFTDWECIYSTKYEYFFTEELKLRQSHRVFLNRTAHW